MVDNMNILDLERYNRLLELYGALLSEKAYEVLHDYLVFGLSITEIAENRGITKQSVSTTIRRALRRLEEYEDKLALDELTDMLSEKCPAILEIWMDKMKKGVGD